MRLIRFARTLFFSMGVIALGILSGARPASAQTTVPGGNIVNQTWTLAGSPYRINGDITIPAGAYLEVQPGVVIEVASSDALGSGANTSRVEIIVRGALRVVGSEASPVSIRGVGSGASAWWGISVEDTASEAILRHVTIEGATYGVRSTAPGTSLVLTDAEIRTSSNGIYLLGGTPSIERVRIRSCTSLGVYVGPNAGVTLVDSVIRENSGPGIRVEQSASSTADTVVRRSTINANAGYGVHVASSSGARTVRVQDSIVTNNGSYGIYRTSGGPAVEVAHSNVWGHSSNDFSGTITHSNNLSANPLYVGTGANLRLTSNSPCRFASSTGGDIGALPYTGDPTPDLVGTLWTNTTLTAAGSPYTVPGDLTVAPGVVLTLEPGAQLRFASSDVMRAGTNTTQPELIVQGRVVAAGTADQWIELNAATGSAGSWYGVRLVG